MKTTLLKGKNVADHLMQEIKDEIAGLKMVPKLSVVLIGEDPASKYYVASIERQGKKAGIEVEVLNYPDIDEEDLVHLVHQLNSNPTVHGIMIQKPLPKKINEILVNNAILPEKDVDAIHPINAGRLFIEQDTFHPCTAQAIIEMLKYYDIKTKGKHTVVVGRSLVVGKPLANLLLGKSEYGNATVTVCHSQTDNLAQFTSQADILICAIGKANFIKKDMIKIGAVIIDAGINEIFDDEGKSSYTGDVDFAECHDLCSAITPVPGGVGSVTTAVLLKHVIKSAKKIKFLNKIVD